MEKLVYLLESILSHGPFHFCLGALMTGGLGRMFPQTTVRLQLYFFQKKINIIANNFEKYVF